MQSFHLSVLEQYFGGLHNRAFFFFFPKARLYFHCSRPISIHNLWLHSAGLRRLKQPFNDVSAFLGELWCKPLWSYANFTHYYHSLLYYCIFRFYFSTKQKPEYKKYSILQALYLLVFGHFGGIWWQKWRLQSKIFFFLEHVRSVKGYGSPSGTCCCLWTHQVEIRCCSCLCLIYKCPKPSRMCDQK